MKGAREYAKLFKTGQYGKLYIVSGKHARGRTFRIQVLPEGEKAIRNGDDNLCINYNAVVVYGEISGQPGWTESYGWIHEGQWQNDFFDLVSQAITDKERQEDFIEQEKENNKMREKKRITELLSQY